MATGRLTRSSRWRRAPGRAAHRGRPAVGPGLRRCLPPSDRPSAAAAPRAATAPACADPRRRGARSGPGPLVPGARRSFTGEDVLELQLHGGRGGARRRCSMRSRPCPACARPSPASSRRRAFLNGRLDLTAVEGLADLVAAETRAQARQALRQLEGALGRLLRRLARGAARRAGAARGGDRLRARGGRRPGRPASAVRTARRRTVCRNRRPSRRRPPWRALARRG